ncbi:MAG: EAL domain-containing protein [Isosphaeraceae bacterium]
MRAETTPGTGPAKEAHPEPGPAGGPTRPPVRGDVPAAEHELDFLVQAIDQSAIVSVTAADGTITHVNDRLCKLTGYTREELLGKNHSLLNCGQQRLEFLRDVDAVVSRGQVWRGEMRNRARDGRCRPLDTTIVPSLGPDGRPERFVIIRYDLDGRTRVEESTGLTSCGDSAAGLPSHDRLLGAIREAAEGANPPCLAVLLLDFNRFRVVNEAFGYERGDEVLKWVGQTMLGAAPASAVVTRLRGDQFGVLLTGAGEADALRVAERLRAAVSAPVVVEGRPIGLSASVGISLCPEHGTNPSTLIRRADVAMYAAKNGRSGLAVYTKGLPESCPRRLGLVHEIREAIEEDQLRLYYQPKVDLATARTTGVEALVRWQHPRDGMIPPLDFIPLAEETGLIRPLGRWVLREALKQARAWRDARLGVNVAVNLSTAELHDVELPDLTRRLLDEAGIEPRWLTYEVTETAMIHDPKLARAALDELHAIGVRISIDDFGTGYSSLAYLKTVPADEVKVDRTFVKDLLTGSRDACIVRAVIDLGHNLGMHVVAEGVDREAVAEQLSLWGCESAQGYYFSRPEPPEEITRRLSGRWAIQQGGVAHSYYL